MNKVILIGRLTADPELRQTQSGIASCRFTVACDRRFADKNTGERQADFISCKAWRGTAEFVARFFHKGESICVIGSLQCRKWQDKDGRPREAWEVVADEVTFVDGKNDKPRSERPNFEDVTDAPSFDAIDEDESDLPF